MKRATRGGVVATPSSATQQIRQEPVLAFHDVHFPVGPTELPLESLANSPQARGFLAKEKGKELTHLTQKNAFPNTGGPNDQEMTARFVHVAKNCDLFLAADKS
jgi:hypothetical protein